MTSEREFTVEEANELVPVLKEVLEKIRGARQTILSGAEHIRRSAPRDGGGAFGTEYWEALSTLRREIEGFAERGILLRDPETGLIDFPSRRDGKPVYLCWRLGEDSVGHWHGPDTGFAGRKPL